MKHFLLVFSFLLFHSYPSYAQHITNGQKRIDIPFQYWNDFIILKVRFNNSMTLKFIFDTGAEYTILTKKEYADILGLKYEREFQIVGSDLQTTLVAYLARKVNLKVGSIENPNQDFLVMEEDYFKFEKLTGLKVQGILGANFFKRYVVKIDYKKNVISLYDPQYFSPPRGYIKVPITIFKNKPYVTVESQLYAQDSTTKINLLLDTGASLAVLVYTDTHPALELPEKVIRGNIGRGLGGNIIGFTGRFHEINLGPYQLNNLVANYQDAYKYLDSIDTNQRNGLIGNMILSRFNIIIDYYKETLYLKPNKNFNKKFKFDRSGIMFIASGHRLDEYVVNFVVPGSPADLAGVKQGDKVIRLNGIASGFLDLNIINNKLQKKIGKLIRLVVRRNGKKIKLRFRLKEII